MAKKRITTKEIAERVAGAIRNAIESGEVTGKGWSKPWATALTARPHNPVTGTVYKGINHLWLSLMPEVMESGDPRFVTFNGANELAAKALGVTKEEFKASVIEGKAEPALVGAKGKGVPVFFAKRIRVSAKDDFEGEVDEDGKRWVFVWRVFTVFHIGYVNALYRPDLPVSEADGADPVEVLDAITAALGVTVNHGGDRAFYRPGDHAAGVFVPRPEDFTSTASYAATVLHEVGHWTKGEGVERSSKFGEVAGTFGSAAYAREEIRVEMASAIVNSALGLAGEVEHEHDDANTAEYVASWLGALERNPEEVTDAMRDATKIADFILAAAPAPAEVAEDDFAEVA